MTRRRAPMIRSTLATTFAPGLLALTAACTTAPHDSAADASLLREAAKHFAPLAKAPDAATPIAQLGRALYWDTRLSADGKTSCASCHEARDWGSDRRRFSVDAKGALTSRQSQTVFNSMTQPTLRWNGDRKDGPEQAEGSLTGSLGFPTRDAALQKLKEAGYGERFVSVFAADATPLSTRNYGLAVAAYEATLVTPAPFDRWLQGDARALSRQQKAGLRAFIDAGCAACHNGDNLGGRTYQRFGIVKPYWQATGSEKQDVGRFSVTRNEEDRYVFRVPMLRNIARTAPYFHDGSVEKLEDAVRVMADVQLGRRLDAAVVADIAAFLESLTGDVPANYTPPGGAPR
jgi:cytochrome c peroxidase